MGFYLPPEDSIAATVSAEIAATIAATVTETVAETVAAIVTVGHFSLQGGRENHRSPSLPTLQCFFVANRVFG